MATENKRMKQRIDTLANWENNNPLIEPGETCYIEGSTEYRVNVSSTATNFLNCQLFKGTDTVASNPGNGTTTLQRSTGTTVGSWSANQSSANTVTLPNFVENAKVDFPVNDLKRFINEQWTAGQPMSKKLPNCVPIDLLACIIREWGALLQTNGTQSALRDGQTAFLTSLGLVDLNS